MEYFTSDGSFTRVYGHHFVLLNHFCHGIKVSLPFYLMSSLRANFRDHKKNPIKFPILHEELLVLIDSHFCALLAPSDYIPTSSKDDTSSGESGGEESNSDFEADSPPPHIKTKSEISPKAKSSLGKDKNVWKQLVISSSSTLAGKDSPMSSGKKAKYEGFGGGKRAFMKPDNENLENPPSPLPQNTTKDLHAKSVELSDKRDDYENVLGMVRDHTIDTFSMFKWLFHELKEVRLNQRALGSKMEAIPLFTAQENQKDNGQWMKEEKKSMVEGINRVVEDINQMQKIFEDRLTHVEENYKKIQATLMTIMANSHKIVKQTVEAMNAMVNNFDKVQQEKVLINIGDDNEESG